MEGIYDARNIGLDMAVNIFIDPNDIISLRYYEILYKTLQKIKSHLVFCNYKKFRTNSNISFEDEYCLYNFDL